ncbi:Polyketide cyclase SnoaL-like protein [Dioscorea alata]|uniref:Polyketide cyclase SnoaL-like protein n=1 Tax=Dioscorea alata TaxID=55571 RepID=A0ACB7VW53_DIOAL|nr:Polyketide cyclase SnoaL-like protein [Dioscorea alata]
MAFLLPKLSPPLPLHSHPKFPSQNALPRHFQPSSSLPDLHPPPPLRDSKLRPLSDHPLPSGHGSKDDFYLNLGLAVRTLRDDLPALFLNDLNYEIYREDITFVDPLNTFRGIDNYKLIFWALRFHGRVLFREIGVEVLRVWQPSETMILIRWEMQGVPRVPWEARGRFQGTSRYKVDRNGKIYEHKVDNLAFNFPRVVKPATVLDLVAASACPASPNLTFRWDAMDDVGASSWLGLYRAVRGTLVREGCAGFSLEGLMVSCS